LRTERAAAVEAGCWRSELLLPAELAGVYVNLPEGTVVQGRSNCVGRHQTVLSGYFRSKDGSGAIQLRWPPPDRPFRPFQVKRTVKGRSNCVGRHQTVRSGYFRSKGRSRGDPTALAATRPSVQAISGQKDGQGAIQLRWPPPDRPFRPFQVKGRFRGDPTALAATRPSFQAISGQKDGSGAIQLRWPPPDRPFRLFQVKRTVQGRSNCVGRHQTVRSGFFRAKGRFSVGQGVLIDA